MFGQQILKECCNVNECSVVNLLSLTVEIFKKPNLNGLKKIYHWKKY